MNLVYHSTRNSEETATASEAILKGLTSDGGLFVPDSIPKLNVSLEDLTQMSYQEIDKESRWSILSGIIPWSNHRI